MPDNFVQRSPLALLFGQKKLNNTTDENMRWHHKCLEIKAETEARRANVLSVCKTSLVFYFALFHSL